MRNLTLIVFLVSLTACQHSVIDEVVDTNLESLASKQSETMQTVIDKKNEWKAKDISNYSFVWQNSCFCMREYTQPIKVHVSNGIIVEANYLDNGNKVGTEVKESIKTYDQIFALLEKYVGNAAKTSINYDDKWAVPKSIFIDRDERMADEEITLSLRDFKVL